MRSLQSFVLLCVLLVSVVGVTAQNGAVGPLPVEVVSAAKSFAPVDIDVSPDGLWVAYTLTDPRRRKLQGIPSDQWKVFNCTGALHLLANTDLLITNTKTGQTINVSSGRGASWGPSWSPDGKSLAFYSDRSGKAHVWIWERATGKLRPLTSAVVHVRLRFEKIFWTPDGKQVLTKVLGDRQKLNDCFDGTTNRPPFDPSTRSIYSSETPKRQLPASTGSFLADLALLDTRAGTVKRIVRQEKIVAYSLSPPGDRVVYLSPTQVKPTNQLLFDYTLSVVGLSTGKLEQVRDFSPGVPSLPASWSPDGQTLAYISAGECFIWSRGEQPHQVTSTARVRFVQAPLWDQDGRNVYVIGENKIWRVSTDDANAVALTKTWNRQIRGIISRHDGQQIWSRDRGESFYVLTNNTETKQEGFYRVDSRSGDFTPLLESDISLNTMLSSVSPDDALLVYASQSSRQEQNLWTIKADFAHPRQLTRLNPELERYPTGESRLIEYSTADGKRLRATLLLPVNYQPNKRYPLIVWVYGGSLLSDRINQYGATGNEHFNTQLFSARGYAVLLPDTPLAVGTPMQDLAKTILPGVEKAIDLHVADPDRLGIMGFSYGGYSTLAMLVQTTRFKAAFMDAGLGSLSGQYGVMLKNGAAFGVGWAEEGQGRMAGPPWQFPERYVQNSPLFFLHKVQTPLLISQGGMDIAPFLSDEIFVGLRRLGRKVVYVRYENEGHGIELYHNRIDYWNRVIEWFGSNLHPELAK